MSHTITLVGRVQHVVRRGATAHNGHEVVVHVGTKSQDRRLWFTVKAQGKVAACVQDEIDVGDMVTVIGVICAVEEPVAGNIYIHAKTLCVHGLEGGQGNE